MNDIKPCPFCGKSGAHKENCYINLYFESEVLGADIPWEVMAKAWNTRAVNGETSDGYHTFNELYHHRAVLFSKIVEFAGERAWKSKLHADGTMFDGYFIVGVETPTGQATYHYAIDPYWEIFNCKEVEHAPAWDGHTPQEAIDRIEHWDARAERTCKYERSNPDASRRCTSCDYPIMDYNDIPNYCPNCGARVVGD